MYFDEERNTLNYQDEQETNVGDFLDVEINVHRENSSSDSDIEVYKTPQPIVSSDDDDDEMEENFPSLVEKQVVRDEKGRPHIVTNRSGHGYIFLASSQVNPSTSTAHANDLLTIFDENPDLKKKVIILICDDGINFSSLI